MECKAITCDYGFGTKQKKLANFNGESQIVQPTNPKKKLKEAQ